MNINTQWTQPDVYMWDQLLFPIKQSFLRPDDVWMMSNETAWKNCDFSGATFIGNASVGNDILTPPYLLAYASDFFFAAEANNGCQANQKIRITVLEGKSHQCTQQVLKRVSRSRRVLAGAVTSALLHCTARCVQCDSLVHSTTRCQTAGWFQNSMLVVLARTVPCLFPS